MKLTSVGWKNLEDIVKIKALVKNYPNDMELGGKVRALFWERKPHYPSKEMRDSWNKDQS